MAVTVYIAPPWFLGYDALFQTLFALVCIVISAFAFRVASRTGAKPVQRIGWSFSLLALSYFVQAATSTFLLTKLSSGMTVASIMGVRAIGMYLHILLMLAGLGLFATMGFESLTPFWLTLIPALVAVLYAENALRAAYTVTSGYLLFLSAKFGMNYFRKKGVESLLISLAFILLLASHVGIFLSGILSPSLYALAHFLALVSYLMILGNLYLVLKKGGPKAVKGIS